MKKLAMVFLVMLFMFDLIGCNNKSMNYIISNNPCLSGIVEEVHGDYFIMYSETAEGYPNGSRWSVSLNAENKNSYTDVVVGDEVVMYYDGMAMETDEGEQISQTTAIANPWANRDFIGGIFL